jgi:hypothetical protein
MYERRFTKWVRWTSRRDLRGLEFPGVYVIVRSSSDLSSRSFSWLEDIIYVGMTNGLSGLRGRLAAFDTTLRGRLAHGGADRVRYRFPGYAHLSRRLYVSVASFKCDPASISAEALRVMGNVARFEYLCLAYYMEKFKKLPKFNDKAISPKYSRSAIRT